MNAPASLEAFRLSLVPAAGPANADAARLLGLTCIGSDRGGWAPDLPTQELLAPVLGGKTDGHREAWRSTMICRSGEGFGIRFRCDGELLYGVVEVRESDYPASADATPLQRATEDAYRRIFQLLDGQAYPHLWRVWNYLAEINESSHGLERYRQFNIGREAAFLGCGRLAVGNVPAACALGFRGGPLTIAFLAGRSVPTPVENPRQVSAYHYPAQYGPRSPVFARASLARLPGQELLFISGTASIVGHRTVHPDDVRGQTRETLANIEALLLEAGRVGSTGGYELPELEYRAYIRHADDFAVVRQVVEARLGTAVSVVYVQADICRADLLVEIEAMASHALEVV